MMAVAKFLLAGAAALSALPALAIEPVAGGAWVVSQETDSFTDKTTVTASAKGKFGQLAVMLHCDQKRELGFVVLGLEGSLGGEFKASGIKRVPLDFRSDAKPAHTFTLMGKGRFAFLSPDDDGFSVLLSEIPDARQKIIVRSIALNGSILSDELSTAGSRAAFTKVKQSCGS